MMMCVGPQLEAEPRFDEVRACEKADDCAGLRLLCEAFGSSVRPSAFCEEARPAVEHLAPIEGESPVDLAPLAKVLLSGAFSLMCTLRMDRLDEWARVFDFSAEPDEDSITAGAIERTNDFHFTVFQGKRPVSVRVNDFFELGVEVTVLCSVSSSGHMKVFKDGVLVGENLQGAAPAPIERPHMIVGGHYHFKDQAFGGRLSNVNVWDQEVSWTAAMQASSAPDKPRADDSTAGSRSDASSVGCDSDTRSETDAEETPNSNRDEAGSLLLLDTGETADPESCDGSGS